MTNTTWKIFVAICFFSGIVVTSCKYPKSGNSYQEATKQNWEYSSKDDKIRNSITSWATCTSLNHENFGSPYEKVSQSIVLRMREVDGFMILFTLSDGQYACNDKCDINVKFDSSAIQVFEAQAGSDGNTGVIFLSPKRTTEFLYNLKHAKKIFIESNYWNHGPQTFEFDAGGLEWNGRGQFAKQFLQNTMLFSDNISIVREAIDSGLDYLNTRDEIGGTPIISAVNHPDIVKLLLSTNKYTSADLNASTKDGITALMVAGMEGDTETVKLLLATGKYSTKELNAKTKKGETALGIVSSLMAYHPSRQKAYSLLKNAGATK